MNDRDAYLSNFWRAVQADPDQVAHFADWPVSEPDLHARHRWLVKSARERVEKVMADPEYFDPKVAGWWVWGQCLWIGSGWCSRPDWTGRANAGAHARGIHGAQFGKLPAIAGRDGGRGAYATSRSGGRKRDPEWQQRSHLGSDGKGQGLIRKVPQLGGDSKGVNSARALHRKRPVLQQNKGGRGVMRDCHGQVPDLSGDSGAAGRGIHASRFEEKSGGLQAYMRALSDRLRRVRVCCGDFERVLGPAVTTGIGLTGVLLDPPYPTAGRVLCYSQESDTAWLRAREWALQNGADPLLRIALCGYEHPDHPMPPEWEVVAWKASGGYGRSARGKANAERERVWFSQNCLKDNQHRLFYLQENNK